MKNRDDFEDRWHEWSRSEPAVDETQLKKNLHSLISDRSPRPRAPLVLVAAAASLVTAILVGIETSRQPVQPPAADAFEMVYETGDNVILVLREGAEPIHVVTNPSDGGE